MNINLIPTARVVHARDEEHAQQLLQESGWAGEGDDLKAMARRIAMGTLIVVRELDDELLDDTDVLVDDAPWLVEMAAAE